MPSFDMDRWQPYGYREKPFQTLKAILGKIRPEPTREPLPPSKVYAPPRATTARRRRG
jgi:hypothetical protein